MTDGLLISAALVLAVLWLGLPLLLKPGSWIPDIIGVAVMAAVIGFVIWSSGNWWILLPVLALVALVVWMDRRDAALTDRRPFEGRNLSRQSLSRLRLWRNANRTGMALLAGIILLVATGSGRAIGNLIVPVLLISMLTTSAFGFAFSRSAARDEQARVATDGSNDGGPGTESEHASPAPLG